MSWKRSNDLSVLNHLCTKPTSDILLSKTRNLYHQLTIVICTSFSIPVPNDTLKSCMQPKLRHTL